MDNDSQEFRYGKEFPRTEEEHCTVVAKVREFSNVSIHNPHEEVSLAEFPYIDGLVTLSVVGKNTSVIHDLERTGNLYTDYEITSNKLKHEYPVTVYANGCNRETDGSISILFTPRYCFEEPQFYELRRKVELTCIVSVINVEGCERYPQSFVIFRDYSDDKTESHMFIDRYISRSVLLNDPTEFLPNDTLTLHIDIILKEHFLGYFASDYQYITVVKRSMKLYYKMDGSYEHHLYLDSLLARRLSEASATFRFMMGLPGTENVREYVPIPQPEYRSFKIIANILFNDAPIVSYSLRDIFNVYTLADKYDIPTIAEYCRNWLNDVISEKNVSNILELAKSYDDARLIEIAESFLSKKNKTENGVAVHDSQLVAFDMDERIFLKEKNSTLFLHNYPSRDEVNVKNDEEDFFDFYS